MKIENYKCDICGKWCDPQSRFIVNKNYGTLVVELFVTRANSRSGNKLDVCAPCVLDILDKIKSYIYEAFEISAK